MTFTFLGKAMKLQNSQNDVFTNVYTSHNFLEESPKVVAMAPIPAVYHNFLEVFSKTKATVSHQTTRHGCVQVYSPVNLPQISMLIRSEETLHRLLRFKCSLVGSLSTGTALPSQDIPKTKPTHCLQSHSSVKVIDGHKHHLSPLQVLHHAIWTLLSVIFLGSISVTS